MIFAVIAMLADTQVPPAPPRTPQAQTQQAPPSDDIVVTGLKDIEAKDSPVSHATLGSSKVGRGAIASHTSFEYAERFAKCAVSGARSRELLRQVLDGRINGARQAFAQAQLVRTNVTCAQDARAPLAIADDRKVTATFVPGYDGTYYDRGALFIQALKTFAPHLRITASQTADPAVQARFNARETSLARFRLPVDEDYFEMAVCLVRLQPELAVRLATTDKASTVARLEAAIVNRARVCTGGAKRVYFDPTQFRFYIADAVYRWTVAVRGVESLIPPG